MEQNAFRRLALDTKPSTQIIFKKAIQVHVEHISDASIHVTQEAYISLTCLFQRRDLNKFLMPYINDCIAAILSNLVQDKMLNQSKELFLAIGEVKTYESLAEKLYISLQNQLNRKDITVRKERLIAQTTNVLICQNDPEARGTTRLLLMLVKFLKLIGEHEVNAYTSESVENILQIFNCFFSLTDNFESL